MFSVVVTTRRDIEALKPLFITSNSDAEIIIIDTNYNEKTKEQLSQLKHEYYKITYAPPMEIDKKMVGDKTYLAYKRDLVRCHNTGFAYAENDWIIKLDDCTELKPDFFDIIREDISKCNNAFKRFIIRPVKLEQWSNHQKWNYPLLKSAPERFIELGREGLGGGLFITLDQAVFPTKAMDMLNGNDERYDIGHGYEDIDLMQRFITLGYTIILDSQLMTIQGEHWTKADPIDFSRLLYEITKIEIENGRYKAYNPYDFKELREKMLSEKDKYEVMKDD